MPWYRRDASDRRHPQVRRLMRSLGCCRLMANAYRTELFDYVMEFYPDGDLSGVRHDDIEAELEWEGEDGVLVRAFLDADILQNGGEQLVLNDVKSLPSSWKDAERKRVSRSRREPNSALSEGHVTGQSGTIRDSHRNVRPTNKQNITNKTNKQDKHRVSETTSPRASKPHKSRIPSSDIDAVLAHYRSHHPQFKRGDKERAMIRARIKDGYSVAELCRAIDALHQSNFHLGQNDSGKTYLELKYALKDSSTVNKWLSNRKTAGERIADGTISASSARNLGVMQSWLRERQGAPKGQQG